MKKTEAKVPLSMFPAFFQIGFQNFQRPVCCLLAVGTGHKNSFKLRRSQMNSPFQHMPEVTGKRCRVRLFGLRIILHRVVL